MNEQKTEPQVSDVFVVRYTKPRKKLLKLPAEHPTPDELFVELKAGHWRKISVETWRPEDGGSYSLHFTITVTPNKRRRTDEAATTLPV